jgi:GNAT superfamily N-acetyltransferase
MQINLRKTLLSDAPFIYQVIEQTMRHHVEATWGRWDPERVERESKQDAVDPKTQIIQFGDRDCGVFYVEDADDALWVRMIFILPEYQRRGIGTELLNRAVSQATKAGIPVRLRVLKVNPAKQYYEQIGFEVYDRPDEFVYMQRAS